MAITNPNPSTAPTPPANTLGGLLASEWQSLLGYVEAQLGGTGWPKWPAVGTPLPWYPAPTGGWSVNGGADGKPVQPLATATITTQQLVDYVRSVWPASINGTAFPALGSTRTLSGATVVVSLSGDGVDAAAASIGLNLT